MGLALLLLNAALDVGHVGKRHHLSRSAIRQSRNFHGLQTPLSSPHEGRSRVEAGEVVFKYFDDTPLLAQVRQRDRKAACSSVADAGSSTRWLARPRTTLRA